MSFNELDEAYMFLDQYAYTGDYFKVEILRTEDRRWRVSLILERQMEFDI